MNFVEFDRLFDQLIEKCRRMRDTKGQEYANSQSDRLANFKEIAEELGIITIGDLKKVFLGSEVSDADQAYILNMLKPNPKAVLAVYWLKHVRSIQHFLKTGEVKSEERIEGRIADAITYLGLLWGLEVDSFQGAEAKQQLPPTPPVIIWTPRAYPQQKEK